MFRLVAATALSLALFVQTADAGDLVRLVRLKLSAGDLPSGMAAVEDYRKATGVDAEYLDAVGWLARGAEMLRRSDLARLYVAELRREIPRETTELIVPYGAVIEVEGRLLFASEGRGAAIRFFEGELARAKASSLRSRIRKNINLLSLEGQPAPPLEVSEVSLASRRGKPVLLYFWAEGCGDCKAQSSSLSRVWRKYAPQGLEMITVTRLYGDSADEEKARVQAALKEQYAALDTVPAVISTETMVRYGASATPTFALIDRKGLVRLYTPTRLSEAELSRRIEEVLSEAP